MSGLVNRHNWVILGSKAPKEYLELEQNISKVKRVILWNAGKLCSSISLLLQLASASVHFAHIVLYCLKVNFRDRWIRRGRPIA
jgi:hypothetical protein